MRAFLYTFLAVTLFIVSSCEKDETEFNSCEKLLSGLTAENATDIGLAINQKIITLASVEYSGENLDKLAAAITTQCGLPTTVTCLNCNHTQPLESEITVLFTVSGNASEQKIIITQTTDNKMTFGRLED